MNLRPPFVVAIFVSCGGVSVERGPSDDDDDNGDGAGGITGTPAPNGARGGTATGGRGGTGALGGAGGRGGTTGGTSQTGGVGGRPTPTGGVSGTTTGGTCAVDPVEPDQTGGGGEGGVPDCDALGTIRLPGYRCENTESYAQGPGYERVDCATTVEDCFEACASRPDCTAVADYLEMRPFLGCALDYDSCDTLSRDPLVAEEDGARAHEKVCAADGTCSFVEIPGNFGCGRWDPGPQVMGAASLDDCKALCLDDPSCTSVQDWFYTLEVPGCYLVTSSCDARVPVYQDGILYPKCP